MKYRELDLMILMGPFQLQIFYDSKDLSTNSNLFDKKHFHASARNLRCFSFIILSFLNSLGKSTFEMFSNPIK